MDKQKQIEEMAKVIDGDCGECYTCKYFEYKGINCTCLLSAEYLYNAGYRKIPENAVVLIEEKYINLFHSIVNNGIFDTIDKVRKETAEKFAEKLKAKIDNQQYLLLPTATVKYMIDEICKEITEGNG